MGPEGTAGEVLLPDMGMIMSLKAACPTCPPMLCGVVAVVVVGVGLCCEAQSTTVERS